MNHYAKYDFPSDAACESRQKMLKEFRERKRPVRVFIGGIVIGAIIAIAINLI